MTEASASSRCFIIVDVRDVVFVVVFDVVVDVNIGGVSAIVMLCALHQLDVNVVFRLQTDSDEWNFGSRRD